MTGDEQAVKVEHEYPFDKNTLQKKEQDMDNSCLLYTSFAIGTGTKL